MWVHQRMKFSYNITIVTCAIIGFSLRGWADEQIAPDNRPQNGLRIDGEKTLTLACGLTVPRILNARGFPLVTVGITRRNPTDDDLSDAYQLWKVDQFVAAWRDPSTNIVSLLRMAYPFPRGYRPEQRLPANEYFRSTRMMAAEGYSTIALDNIQDWLYTYYQGRYSADIIPVWTGQALKECNKFTALINGKAHLIYVFNVKNEKGILPGQVPYFVLDLTREKPGISTELDHFAEQFLKKISFDPLAYLTELDFWSTEPFDSFMQANAVRGVINLADEWRDFHYDPFILLANNPACFDTAAEGLIHLQNIYRLFPTVLPACAPASEQRVSVLRVFATDWEFEDCLPLSRRWASGAYAGNDEIILRGWSNGCNVHESTHQYIDLAAGRRRVSTWFNEGFACYFGGCNVVDDQLVAEPVDSGHLLISMLKKKEMSPIEEVFTVRDFYEDEEMGRNPKSLEAALKRAKNYTAAWGVIYFLREAPTQYPGKNYETLIPLYWETFQRTGDADSATRAVLRKLSMPTFLDDLRAFFLPLEEHYKEKERMRGDPKCDCEFCEMLRRTKQPYPPDLVRCAPPPSPSILKPTQPRRITSDTPNPLLAQTPPVHTNAARAQPSATHPEPEQKTKGFSWGLVFAVIGWALLFIACVRYYLKVKSPLSGKMKLQ